MWQQYVTQTFPDGCQVSLAVTEVLLAYGCAVCLALAVVSELRRALAGTEPQM